LNKNFELYCFSLSNKHFNFIEKLGYLPVALGSDNFDKDWIRENTGKNISEKNKHYGELTFYYWYWKNKINLNNNNSWVGFCHYRRFWLQQNDINFRLSSDFESRILKEIPKEWDEYETILVKPYFINNLKLSKAIKKGLGLIIKNPFLLFNKSLRTINFHFDMWHGKGNLKKAISLLDEENKEDFSIFVNTKTSFNAHLMFFCKSQHLMNKFFDSLFPWLEKCEKVFGFNELKNYDTTRIYAFLAERYLSYWFIKNSNFLEWTMLHHDISEDVN
jgi:hypothetical protein